MPPGWPVTHLANDRLVVIGRPLRVPFGVTALTITRRLEDGFLSGDFAD